MEEFGLREDDGVEACLSHTYLPRSTSRRWGVRIDDEFPESFAGWAPVTSRQFTSGDISRLLHLIQRGDVGGSIIGYNQFPYSRGGQLQGRDKEIEREYWLDLGTDDKRIAGWDGLAVLHVHYAGKWHQRRDPRARLVITQMNIRHTVRPEVAVPGGNAYWHKCNDLDKWKEMHGQQVLPLISPTGWFWETDRAFSPVMHDLLMEAEKCTYVVRALKSAKQRVSPGARKALVIGVESYESWTRLPNAVNDAAALKGALQRQLWTVHFLPDPKLPDLKDAIKRFANEIRSCSDACLFAFVGHGVELRGEHYFIPADFNLDEQYGSEELLFEDVRSKAVRFSFIEECIQTQRPKPEDPQVSVFVLDCCRSGIPTSTLVGDRQRNLWSWTGGGNLKISTHLQNSFIIYSTTKGDTAGDGAAGKGGPFMSIFVEELADGTIQEVMTRTRKRLLNRSDNCQLAEDVSRLTTTSFSFCAESSSMSVASIRQHATGVAEGQKVNMTAEELVRHVREAVAKEVAVVATEVAKQVLEAELSEQSTDEDEQTTVAAYHPGAMELNFRESMSYCIDTFRAMTLDWGDSSSQRRHPFCATVLLDVLRHKSFGEQHVGAASGWYQQCIEQDLCLSGDILDSFSDLLGKASSRGDLLPVPGFARECTKKYSKSIAVLDAAVRRLHNQTHWDGAHIDQWDKQVVQGWFEALNRQSSIRFLDEAERYLRDNGVPKLDLEGMEDAVPTGSFVVFFRMNRFTNMVFFAVIEHLNAVGMGRSPRPNCGEQAAGQMGACGGFIFLASSTGRACALYRGRQQLQLQCSHTVVSLLRLLATSLAVTGLSELLREQAAGSNIAAVGAEKGKDTGDKAAESLHTVAVGEEDSDFPEAVEKSMEVSPVSEQKMGEKAANDEAVACQQAAKAADAEDNALAEAVEGSMETVGGAVKAAAAAARGGREAWSRVCGRVGREAGSVRRAYLEAALAESRWAPDTATGADLSPEVPHITLTVRNAQHKTLWSACDADDEATNNDFLCPILGTVLRDPVKIVGDGRVQPGPYERVAISYWLDVLERPAPLTNTKFEHWELVSDVEKKAVVKAFVERKQEKMLKGERAVDNEAERRLMLHRKGYSTSAVADVTTEDAATDDKILDGCGRGKSFCIIGPPASGKTTTMLRLAANAAAWALENEDGLVPLFVRASELARLAGAAREREASDFVELYIKGAERFGESTREVLRALYAEGLLLVMIDGLDEAEVLRGDVESYLDMKTSLDIETLCMRYELAVPAEVRQQDRACFVVSTRGSSYAQSREWGRLQALELLEMQPLEEAAAKDFVTKRLGDKEQEKILWDALQRFKQQSPELMQNPFLLSLMVSTFRRSHSLPAHRHQLYHLSVESMIRRLPHLHLPSDEGGVVQALHFLQCLAFVCHVELRKRDFTFDEECMRLLQVQWSKRGYDGAAALKVKAELVNSTLVGVLSRVAIKTDGQEEVFRFSHLTQQEYLAAGHVVEMMERHPEGDQEETPELLTEFAVVDVWNREVQLHVASMLKEQAFIWFCNTVLKGERGTLSQCELGASMLAERGASISSTAKTEVTAMLQRKYQELRSNDEIALALCHPSPELRERAITELQSFTGSGARLAVIEKLKQTARGPFHRFARSGAILSLTQLCCDCASEAEYEDIAFFMLELLPYPSIHEVVVKALGTMAALETSQKTVTTAISTVLSGEICAAPLEEDSVTAMALVDLNLTSPPLVNVFAASICAILLPAIPRGSRIDPSQTWSGIFRYIATISNAPSVNADENDRRALWQILLVVASAITKTTDQSRAFRLFAMLNNLLVKCETVSVLDVAGRLLNCSNSTALHSLLHRFAYVVISLSQSFLDDSEDVNIPAGCWFYNEQGSWVSFDGGVEKVLEEAHAKQEQSCQCRMWNPRTRKLADYRFDLMKKDQVNMATGYRRQILREERNLKTGHCHFRQDLCNLLDSRQRKAELESIREQVAGLHRHEDDQESVSTRTIHKPKVDGFGGRSSIEQETLRKWEEILQEHSNTSFRPLPFPCDALWRLCFAGASAHTVQSEDHDLFAAFCNLSFEADGKLLSDDSEEWVQVVMGSLRLPELGRIVFSLLLWHIEKAHIAASMAEESSSESPRKLREMTKLLQNGSPHCEGLDPVTACQIRLERNLLVKELQVGPRCSVAPLWIGQVSAPLFPTSETENKRKWTKVTRNVPHRSNSGADSFLVVTVFPTSEPDEVFEPDEEPSDRVRVYYVERGVEMCVGVKNFMSISCEIEPFYVHEKGWEKSEGMHELPGLGRSQVELKSALDEGETQDGWRLKTPSGEVILTVFLRAHVS